MKVVPITMSSSSNIEWTEATWNPVVGCRPVSPGCLNCYAARMARRLEAMGRPEYAPIVTATDTRSVSQIQREDNLSYASALRKKQSGETIRIAEVRGGRPVFTGLVRMVPDRLTDPLHWRKPRRVLVNSMSDLFHEAVPFEFINQVFSVMALAPQHTFQVLTKRPERMAEYLSQLQAAADAHVQSTVKKEFTPVDVIRFRWAMARRLGGPASGWQTVGPVVPHDIPWPLPNVWLGASVENQATADARIPHLLRCPAAVRFISAEPLLEEVDVRPYLHRASHRVCPKCLFASNLADDTTCPNDGEKLRRDIALDWVIVGGESGPGARPCRIAWIRSIVRQCEAAGVPVFVKQLGSKPEGDPTPPPIYNPETGVTRHRVMQVVDIRSRKGSDPSEWPKDIDKRQMPEVGR
jgi:protein gp37